MCGYQRNLVSASDHLDSAQNGVWFQLPHDTSNKRRSPEWNAMRAGVRYEILETLDDDVSPLAAHRMSCWNGETVEKELELRWHSLKRVRAREHAHCFKFSCYKINVGRLQKALLYVPSGIRF